MRTDARHSARRHDWIPERVFGDGILNGVNASPETIASALAQAKAELTSAENPARLEAEILLAHAIRESRGYLRAWPDREIDAEAAACFRSLVARRRDGEPIAYITGHKEFWSLDLEISDAVLIPRPETERLVELALALKANSDLRVVDAGTGSGAIALALAAERPGWRIVATEISRDALAVAGRNIDRLDRGNVALCAGCWLDSIADARVDLVVSNPPYVADSDPHLGRGDLRFEPRVALAAGGDGLDGIRALAAAAPRCLRPGGTLLLEHGFQQAGAVRTLLEGVGYTEIRTAQDYAGLDRVTRAHWPGKPR